MLKLFPTTSQTSNLSDQFVKVSPAKNGSQPVSNGQFKKTCQIAKTKPVRLTKNVRRTNGRRVNLMPSRELAPDVCSYNGPVVTKADAKEQDLHTVVMAYTTTVVSDGAGVIDSVYGNNPSAFGDWASFAAIFEEFRVLAMRVDYTPWNRYSKVTTTTTVVDTVIDYDDIASLSSYSSIVDYSSVKQFSLDDPFSRTAYMQGVENGGFLPTTSPVPTYAVKYYADSLSFSTTFGRIVLHARVQFRGRK